VAPNYLKYEALPWIVLVSRIIYVIHVMQRRIMREIRYARQDATVTVTERFKGACQHLTTAI